MKKVTSEAIVGFNVENVSLLGEQHPQDAKPLPHQDPTLHAEDCEHTGAVKLGRTSIMEIKILNDDGRNCSEPADDRLYRRAWDFPV